MSTPSPQPLDYDLVSPYAPKPAREPLSPPATARDAAPRTGAIENDNDAKILEEIEASLRAMITAEHAPKEDQPSQDEPAAEAADDTPTPEDTPLAQAEPQAIHAMEWGVPIEDRLSQERRYYEAMRVQEVLQQVSQQLTHRTTQEAPPTMPETEPEHPMEDFRAPPAFLTRPMEPIQLDEPFGDSEPWPRAKSKAPLKTRNSATTLFVRFGFAAGGAAAVMMFALPEVRSRLFETVGTPLSALTSNASAVFGEGRPAPARNDPVAPIAVRTEAVVLPKVADAVATPRLATADLAPIMPDQRIAANIEAMPPQRETVMLPQRPAPEQQNRAQPIWHGPPSRAEAESPTLGLATRPLAVEEIELLRKMGNDFITAGDFAGARGVLERAAEAGDASSALALAATYDPAALARFKVKGLVPDNAKAAFWYERARDLGSQEAPVRLKALARSN